MLLPLAYEKTELLEVVRIGDPAGALRWDRLVGEDVAIWGGEQARQALTRVGELPGGDNHRCFLPGWGLRAHSGVGLLFEVALCFRCHSARTWADGLSAELRFQGFDAESPVARELLDRLRDCVSG
ncbi:hypothetical protein [Streptomyces luteolus]|uniref:Uncharacterized protein n=1 Tax=Streptomyces luteolus TaxID=3043615 RepID=A0ABT6SP49_9ACTN|nr:hypothetical protein [Streptomyces sp. B-S-A12]MDI3417166.1 hypothetical protein [Streptomyces sp. B-S-A12]